MQFKNEIDLFQYFINEYILSSSKILVIGLYKPQIKNILEFIDCQVFFIKETMEYGIDITVENYNDLPFEDNSFDCIINFTNEYDLKVLSPNGKMLLKGEILNGIEYYTFINELSVYTVI